LFFVSGCSNQEKPAKTNKRTNEIVIYNGLDNPENQRALDFVEFLKAEKGITLVNEEWKLSTTPVIELNGLLKIHASQYKFFYDNRHDYFLPLNEILSSNVFSGNIPQGIQNAVSDEDGNIWGLLPSHRFETRSRIYSEEAMELIGKEIPNTAEEFHELLLLAKGVFEGDIIKISKDSCASSFYDIFAYFGCDLISGIYTIGWDLNTGKFVDQTFTEEMYKSLQFIKKIDDEGLITVGMGQENLIYNGFRAGNLFTMTLMDYTGLTEEYSSNAFDGSEILLEIGIYNSYVYVVPKNTSDAEYKLSYFIDTFFGDEKINKAGRWGIEGTNYTYVDADFVKIEDINAMYLPKLTDCWLDCFYIPLIRDDNKDEYEHWISRYWQDIREDYYNGVYKVLPLQNSIDFTDRIQSNVELHNAFNNLLYEFLDKNLSVEEFLKEYETKMIKLGVTEYLDGLNTP